MAAAKRGPLFSLSTFVNVASCGGAFKMQGYDAIVRSGVAAVHSHVDRLASQIQDFWTATKHHLNGKLVALLLMGGLLVASVSYGFVQHSVDGLLRSEAGRTAEQWARHFVKRMPNIEAIAAGRALSRNEERIITELQEFGSVFLFKLFDAKGKLRLVSNKRVTFGKTKASLIKHNPKAAGVVQTGYPFIDVKDGRGKSNRPALYSEAYVPVFKNGRTVAVVEVYVDQAARAADYRAQAAYSSSILALISAIVFGVPAFAFYIRSQQVVQADARIHFLAQYDALTGLPNREHFNSELKKARDVSKRSAKTAVLCLDLDRFKHVNDTLGHAAGDKLLQLVALRLSENVRGQDIVSRIGGDEFAVIQPGIESGRVCAEVSMRLIKALSEPFQVDGNEIQVGTSIGIAMSHVDGVDHASLVKAADIAMYRAKADGRGTFRFFEKGMDEELQKRRQLEADLRRDFANSRLELYYQPLVDVASNSTVAYEALLRWNHPDKGLITPDNFIPIAEESGLIKQIGAWVLRKACKEAAKWPDTISVAVNISAVQFLGKTLVSDVEEALELSGLKAERLELEITESVVLGDTGATVKILDKLRKLGVRISMDDFGTGYSSLSYLQKFSFDKIKIDKSFVAGLGEREDAAAIIRAVVGIGHSLGMQTTAEGVETTDQLELLCQEGCSQIQGYLISKPVPASELSGATDAEEHESARTSSNQPD